MRYLFKFISVCSLCVAMGLSGQVMAAVPLAAATKISQMTDWHISPITNIAGGAPYCIMAARFDNNLIMTFARNNANQYSLGIDGQQPYFDTGLNYGVKLSVGAQTRALAAKASDENLIVANLGQDTNLFDVAARGETIHVVVANNVIDQYVQAKPQAFFELAHCWQGLPKPIVPEVPQPMIKAVPLPPAAAIQPAPPVAAEFPIEPMAQDKAKNLAPQAVMPLALPVIAPAPTAQKTILPPVISPALAPRPTIIPAVKSIPLAGKTVLPTTAPALPVCAPQLVAAPPVTPAMAAAIPPMMPAKATSPTRDALADILQQSRTEAAQTNKLNTQEAVMAKNPVKASDTLPANKLVVPTITTAPANLPAPVAGPRQKLGSADEETQLAKPKPEDTIGKTATLQPLQNGQRSKLLFDKAPAPAPSMIKLAPEKVKNIEVIKPVVTTSSNNVQLRDAAKIFPQLGVAEKPDLSSPFTWEVPKNDSITGVVSVHKLSNQTLAAFVAQRLAKAAQVCGKDNFSPSQGPLQKTTDGRSEIVVQSICRKGDATSSVAIYEQAGTQVRHWQVSGAMAEQAAMLQLKNNIQQQLNNQPNVQPMGTPVPQAAVVN